ncbi:TRAP transporter small permease [Breoghania sp. L-A4]|uniref:TRAP transporter small permease n=1 Tax=Breoghania sp. L-A4 TaxID=2304600 RepID=UPI000E35A8EB|nr:TRAP transporter small permease [Breoghania sp. L-A4]AXS42303.1 TRAP transporter small permease [Breoghania sp. L-A4]
MTDETARPSRGLAHSTPVEWAVRALTLLSSIALAILLIATFAGVIMRYVFSAPILGGNEIIELVSVALVMLAMPSAAQREDHVRVDVFDNAIGATGRFLGDILARGISIYLLSLLAWRTWAKLRDAAEFGDATNMLAIPLWPFYGLLALGAALYALVLALQLADVLRAGVSRNE